MKIEKIFAQELLDSRGNPTVGTEIVLENGEKAFAMVPSGASTGVYEALELRDKDENRYLGKGVLKAVKNVNEKIAPELKGMDVEEVEPLDKKMLELDGTENKSNLGANAILSVSMAAVKAGAKAKDQPLYFHIAELFNNSTEKFYMPIPMMNVLNGGKHAMGSSDMQEYMIMPIGAPSVVEAVRWGCEVFHTLGKMLKERGMRTTVGDEGGYAPKLTSNEQPLELMSEAVEKAGYKLGEDFGFAMDPAASEFYEDGKYNLAVENRVVSSEELVEIYAEWVEKYPIVSIEDGFAEDDWDGFVAQMKAMGDKIQIVGDDLFVTNVARLSKGIKMGAANSILIKLNQIGTVTETIKAIHTAEAADMTSVVSHRSGETEDSFIADFVVGAGTGQIKTGSLSRSERLCKYNNLMRTERALGEKAEIAPFPF